ncbi:MAG: oligosaccharide flippase family protein [Deltaproteobacteria bacterium]|nr:oligosaccharide flippase family protein [Deltaproteobacteria bacterium]
MSNARVYARNLAANWIGHGASMLVLFFLSPFVIHTLGNVQYGIWSLLAVLTGYMGILDLGVRASTGRHITLYIGKEDYKSVDETIRTSLAFFSAVGILIVSVGVALGWAFPKAFSSVPIEYHALVRLLLPILALNMWITTFGSVLASVLIAHDRFDLSNAVGLVTLAIRTAGTVLVLNAGMGLLGLTLIVVGCNVLGVIVTWMLARKVYRRLKVWPFVFSKLRMREILGYGVAAFVSAIAIKIIGQTDLVIVGATIGIEEVTTYSVGAMLIYYSSTFIRQIGGTFFPPVQRAVAKGEMEWARWLFFRQVRLSLICGLPIYIGFIIFAEPFIRLWMTGPNFPQSAVESAALVMGILAGSKLFYLLTVGSGGLLAAMGHIWFNAAVAIIEAGLNLGLSLLFVLGFGWGLAGIAAGTLVSLLMVGTFIQPCYACKKAKIAWRSFLVNVVRPGLLGGFLFAIPCLAIRHMLLTDSWGIFLLQVVSALVAYCPVALWVLLPTEDRRRFVVRFRALRYRERV